LSTFELNTIRKNVYSISYGLLLKYSVKKTYEDLVLYFKPR